MNFEQSTSFMQEEEKKDKKKKIVIIFIGLCLVLLLVIIGLIAMIQYEDSQTLKMFLNGTQINISSTLYKQIENQTYINVKEMGNLLGYNYTQGEYNKYNENETSCYLTSDYEIVTLTVDNTYFVKYAQALQGESVLAEIPVTVKSEKGDSQKYALNNSKIQLIDGMIYAPFEALTDMFNAQADLSEKNRIKIYSFDRIIANTKSIIAKLGYTSMNGDYENLKAMLYGLAVVGDGTKLGVVSLSDGKEIIGIKYEDITFIPNVKDFFIKAGETVGIFSNEGSTVIQPSAYDEISVYDEDNQLYLVRKDGKYGILNRLGKEILYTDYDEIGYEFSNKENVSEEYKIIFENCIPVKEGSKYGLYSLEGEELLPCVYDEFGSTFSEDTLESNEKPILLIPPEIGIKGIIINQNGLYGVYDTVAQQIIIPCVCTKAYSVTKSAKTTYYVEHAEVQYNLDEYLAQLNLKSVNTENNNTEEVINTEEVTNTEELDTVTQE